MIPLEQTKAQRQKRLLRKNWRASIVILILVTIACPMLYFTIDLSVATYTRYDLAQTIRRIAHLTHNVDDYILFGFIAAALYVKFKLKDNARFQHLVFMPYAALSIGILNQILKIVLGRWRPKGYFNFGEYGFDFFKFGYVSNSFPSGHSCSIMVIMTAIAILKPKYRAACYLFAVVLASARVITHAHYPSDVIAGLSLGYVATHWLRYLFVRKNWLPTPCFDGIISEEYTQPEPAAPGGIIPNLSDDACQAVL